jgi:hypothetical protein
MEQQEDEEGCDTCRLFIPGENWIACDHCDKWYHQRCEKLRDEEVPKPDEQYKCIRCKGSSGYHNNNNQMDDYGEENPLM